MEEMYHSGKIKAIGVSNFLEDRLVDLILNHDIVPAINQVEMHPFCQQKKLRAVMQQYDIKTMAWGPFAEGRNNIFTNKELATIGSKYGKSPSQVILRWLRQESIIAIPKSVHLERMQENFMVDDFELSQKDIEQIENLDLEKGLILKIQSLDEVYRLNNIRFKQ
jgi:diketogulonate reductase-like aldo/keto reductase